MCVSERNTYIHEIETYRSIPRSLRFHMVYKIYVHHIYGKVYRPR